MAKIIKTNKSFNTTNVISKKSSVDEVFKSIAQGITSCFIVLLLVLFPVYTHEMYFDVLSARYTMYKVFVLAHMILLILLAVIYFSIERNNSVNPNGTAFERFLEAIKLKNLPKHITATDVFFIIMISAMSISTYYTRFKTEAFYGTAGRYQGLEGWILYMISYFCISRTFKFKKYHLDLAVAMGAFISFWGVTDFFYLDIFHFFTDVQAHQIPMFMSSIGNLNTFTNYTIMIFAVAAILFMQEKNIWKSIFYGFCTYMCILGSIFGMSDNTVVGFAAFFIATPFIALKDKRSVVRFFYVSAMFFFGITSLYIGMKYFGNLSERTIAGLHYNWSPSTFKQLAGISLLRWIFIPFLLGGIALQYVYRDITSKDKISKKSVIIKNVMDEPAPKYYVYGWLIFVIISFAAVVFILIDVNVLNGHEDLWKKIPFYDQLRFNDDWGTHRGHNWRIAITNWKDNFDVVQKLFGYGPDTYLVVSERTFYQEMVQKYGEVYDSAHNEYLNYLVCEGAVGLISYLGIFISGIIYGLKAKKENILIAACIVAVIAYMAQAVVNIAIPITTPVFFTFMYMGVGDYLDRIRYKEV